MKLSHWAALIQMTEIPSSCFLLVIVKVFEISYHLKDLKDQNETSSQALQFCIVKAVTKQNTQISQFQKNSLRKCAL